MILTQDINCSLQHYGWENQKMTEETCMWKAVKEKKGGPYKSAAYYQASENTVWKNRIMSFEMEQGLLLNNYIQSSVL